MLNGWYLLKFTGRQGDLRSDDDTTMWDESPKRDMSKRKSGLRFKGRDF